MPKKNDPQKLTLAKNYPALVRQVRTELDNLVAFVRVKSIECYWNIGRHIHHHILENKARAQYGALVLDKLSEDVGKDVSTLRRTLGFYRAYPQIRASRHELSWTQYRQLITIQDPGKRKQLEEQLIKKRFDTRKSQAFLNFKKIELAAKSDPDKPITRLAFTRGGLWTYGVVENPDEKGEFLLDLGFRVRKDFPEGKSLRLGKDDCVKTDSASSSISKASAKKEELFTYKAQVEKIIDGDTLTALIDLGFDLSIQQKLRLRGIDCPEMDTGEGKGAKKFVQGRLNRLDFIVVKTFKDSTDKYDRYLADIFYLNDERDLSKVAAQGNYLNQELLDERLACAY